jgi:DnaK suppressor protein
MSKKRSIKGKLSPLEVQKFKAVLLAKRNEILGNVASMENESIRRERSDLSNMPIHMADVGTDNFDIENTLELMDSERKLLRQIDEALQRIEEGTYLICCGCNKPISNKRLKAVPWAKYCVDCARIAEESPHPKSASFNDSTYGFGNAGLENMETDISGEEQENNEKD